MSTLLNEKQHSDLMEILFLFEEFIETLPPDILLPPAVDEMFFFASFAVKELEQTPTMN